MTDVLSDYERQLLARNDEVVSVLKTISPQCDLSREPPREVWQAYIAAGLKGLLVSQAQGGCEASAAVMVRMSEALGAIDPIATLTFLPQEYCISALARYGHHAWHEEMLRVFIAGEKSTGFVLTEPDVGSDATAITTLALADTGGWRLNGTKAWVTNAPYIDEYFVFAQTEAGSGARGIAGFLVPRESAGVNISEPYELLGGHVGNICNVRFENVILASERLIVPPGDGMRAALSAIDLARINVAAMCCGALATGLDIALDYTTTRKAFGEVIANFQGLQWQLAEVATDLHAAKLMSYEAATLLDQQGRASTEAAHAKKFATRAALKGLDICMGQLGSNGLKRDTALPRLFEHVKVAHTLDGTTDIQNVVISRALLAQYRDRLS